MERGLVGDEGAHEGLVDASDGEVEVDVLRLVGHVEGDDDVVVAGGRGADVGEDAGVGGVEHDDAAVADAVAGAAHDDEALVPVEERVGVG